MKRPGIGTCSCDPSSGEGEEDGSLRLAGPQAGQVMPKKDRALKVRWVSFLRKDS